MQPPLMNTMAGPKKSSINLLTLQNPKIQATFNFLMPETPQVRVNF